jgi:hypothetical protein
LRTLAGLGRHLIIQKAYQSTQLDIADSLPTEIGNKLTEWKLTLVESLQRLGEDDSVNRYKPEVRKKPGLQSNVAGIFLAIEVAQ